MPRGSGKRADSATALAREIDLQREELATQTEELARAVADMAAAKDRYARLFDLAPTACFVLDGTGRIVEANQAAAALVGVDRAALTGMPFEQLIVPQERNRVRA